MIGNTVACFSHILFCRRNPRIEAINVVYRIGVVTKCASLTGSEDIAQRTTPWTDWVIRFQQNPYVDLSQLSEILISFRGTNIRKQSKMLEANSSLNVVPDNMFCEMNAVPRGWKQSSIWNLLRMLSCRIKYLFGRSELRICRSSSSSSISNVIYHIAWIWHKLIVIDVNALRSLQFLICSMNCDFNQLLVEVW